MLNDPIPLAARQSSSTAKAQNIPFGLHVVLRRKYSKQHAGISFHLHDVFKTRKVGDTTKPDSQSNTVLQYITVLPSSTEKMTNSTKKANIIPKQDGHFK
jgi:hypothetical protein